MNACWRETRIDFVFVYINIAMRTFPVFSARMGTKSAKWQLGVCPALRVVFARKKCGAHECALRMKNRG